MLIVWQFSGICIRTTALANSFLGLHFGLFSELLAGF